MAESESPTGKSPSASTLPAAADAPEASTAPLASSDAPGRAPSSPSEERPDEPPAPAPAKSSPPAARASTAPAKSSPPAARASDRPSLSAKASSDASGLGPLGAYEAIARSARLPDLVAVAQKVISEAALLRPSGWSFAGKASAAADELKLSRADADTPFGNALKVLESGPEGEAERALASALYAHAIAEGDRDDEERLAGDLLWLAAHTSFDATPLLDRALGEEARDLWTAVADRVKRAAAGQGSATGRGEAIVGAAALSASSSTHARTLCAELASSVRDPVLVAVLASRTEAPREVRFEGEVAAPPRGRFATTVLALTGLLFVIHAIRAVARLALAYRRPAEVSLSSDGIRVKTRTEMLGRVLREREHVILRSGLVRVVREVRYPRAAFYAGLLALALGSYLGVRAFVDGVRSASPSLLMVGLVIVALGVLADFVLGSVVPGVRGRCKVAFVPRAGPVLCVADVDLKRADEALASALR